MLKQFAQLILKKLRLSNPWNYKAPFLIGVPYLVLLLTKSPPQTGYQAIGWSFLTILGIAGFGYLSNDFMDREKDAAAGKFNVLLELKNWQIAGLLLFFLTAALLPWILFFPLNRWTISLLVFEFLLFIAYATPPLRLKERGFAGAITDALYAHAVPCTLAAITFFSLDPSKNQEWQKLLPWLALLAGFQFFLGIRNILLHQLHDLENDHKSKTKTWVVKMGPEKGWKWIKWFLLPLETLLFLGFGFAVFEQLPWILVGIPVFLVYTFVRVKWILQQNFPKNLRDRIYLFLDEFYVRWVPLLILLGLVIENYAYAGLILLHIILFNTVFSQAFRELRSRFFSGSKPNTP